MGLLEQIKKPNAKAFTHSGKFHADDVFSSALLLYLNPQITITRGNRVPEDYDGIVFDIGRGRYDHHQRDSRVRENGVPYAAFGLLWEELGGEILGGTLAQRFDEEFVQPLDNNDNTGEKNELATLIGNFNPVWDAQKNIQKEEERISAEPALTAEEKSRGLTKEFQRAVQMAGMILENKFARYRADARADAQIEEVLSAREDLTDTRILVFSEFVPCQKRLKETDIAFVIFPSNRGGYCIQPQKKPDSMNYKCSFPSSWLGLEGEELSLVTGLKSAAFCHKGGFLMICGTLEDSVLACRSSLAVFHEEAVIVSLGGNKETDMLLQKLPDLSSARIVHLPVPQLPELTLNGIYGELSMEKTEWKSFIKDRIKEILRYKPEAVFADNAMFSLYPIVHALRKKHIPVLTAVEKDGQKLLVRIPSGS